MSRPRKTDDSVIVGLDIGTSKVAAIVGRLSAEQELEIIGIGAYPSRGLKKGVVVNIESTVESIHRAVEEAELMAGYEIKKVHAGIAGRHIGSFNSHGIVAIKDHEVSHMDISRVVDAARAVAIPADQKILHILPQSFKIDDQFGVLDPFGMSGVRLEVDAHLVTGSVSAAQNIVKCVHRCGLEVGDIILEQLASSYAVLTEDEKNLGVCLVDIGGGTTDIAIFVEGAIRHTAVIPIAGDQVTNDLAVALRTSTSSAERIKIESGCGMSELVKPNQVIDVPCVGERVSRPVLQQRLVEVIAPRYEELFLLIQSELRRSGLESMIGSGIVLTGGSSKMMGILELAESVFQMQVRLGVPRNISGLIDVIQNPIYSTGVGLLFYALQAKQALYQAGSRRSGASVAAPNNLWSKLKRWFQGYG